MAVHEIIFIFGSITQCFCWPLIVMLHYMSVYRMAESSHGYGPWRTSDVEMTPGAHIR